MLTVMKCAIMWIDLTACAQPPLMQREIIGDDVVCQHIKENDRFKQFTVNMSPLVFSALQLLLELFLK